MKSRNQKVIINYFFDLNKMSFLIMYQILYIFIFTAGQKHSNESPFMCNIDLCRQGLGV